MPLWIVAGAWGFVAGLVLLLGAAAGYSMYIFGLWGGITVISGSTILLGYALFGQFSPDIVAATTAVAAGAMLAMLADTMIPEACEHAHTFAGLITVVGFLMAFVRTKVTEK
jgi:ZIP family zinc transporter